MTLSFAGGGKRARRGWHAHMLLHVSPAGRPGSRALNRWQNTVLSGGGELWKLPAVKPGYLKFRVTQLGRNAPHGRISVQLGDVKEALVAGPDGRFCLCSWACAGGLRGRNDSLSSGTERRFCLASTGCTFSVSEPQRTQTRTNTVASAR